MRNMILAMALAAAFCLPARADESAFRQVISAQIDAFLADDFATAFTYASPTIRSVFGTPERFGAMVRQGYPMVWRPAEVEFLSARQAADGYWQQVVIRDEAGAIHILEYDMIETEDGWKINAVRFNRRPGGTA